LPFYIRDTGLYGIKFVTSRINCKRAVPPVKLNKNLQTNYPYVYVTVKITPNI
jgi:hypothetical protein